MLVIKVSKSCLYLYIYYTFFKWWHYTQNFMTVFYVLTVPGKKNILW